MIRARVDSCQLRPPEGVISAITIGPGESAGDPATIRRFRFHGAARPALRPRAAAGAAADPPPEAGDAPAGQLDRATGQQAALLLIDSTGRLQNLSAALDPEIGVFTLPRFRLRATQSADGMFLVMALSSAQALSTVALIPDNAILPAAQTTQFWQFLATDIAAAEGGIRATLAALSAAP